MAGPIFETLRARRAETREPLFEGYKPLPGVFDEFFDPEGRVRPAVANVVRMLDELGKQPFRERQQIADTMFMSGGITFSVYSDTRGVEKVFPFDLIPRIVANAEWQRLEAGLKQRVLALNAFLNDVYAEQRILKEQVIDPDLVLSSKGYVEKMRGVRAPKDVRIHVAGIDLIRAPDGEFAVLEDNVRTPSGVSYVLENRMVMKKVLPRIFAQARVMPIEEYPVRLRRALRYAAPELRSGVRPVVLTPGRYNSAYFEHSFLARRMGCELVEGQDLFVDGDFVYAKTTEGPRPVEIIYRRIDDAFLDPEAFNPDSLLGVPGLVRAYAKGNVTIANAIGNGVADDKGIYPFVPDIIRFYLGEEPLLRQVPTYVCARPEDLRYVLEHIDELVVKAVNEAGGYGMLVGPQATRRQRAEFRERIKANPRNYIAQPRVELSTCPAWTPRGVGPRRIDLRPYIVLGESPWVMPGGLTRVALVKGSYVVNSSQGGGSKDTWILEEDAP